MTTIQKTLMTVSVALVASLMLFPANPLFAQASKTKQQIMIDITHGQKFYNDPADMDGEDPALIERIKYMNGELVKNANTLNAEVSHLKTKITPDVLAKCDLLFIHIPSSNYSAEEIQAIQQYIQKGGSLFLVMEVDYWSTLAQANVNDIVKPYDIVFKGDNPDTQSSGGYTTVGEVATQDLSIPYHGARMVEGCTPFCFSKHTEDNPFGIYKELDNGGKIIAMRDGMVSLYMTSWEGVHNYQCAEFMQDVFAWLLK